MSSGQTPHAASMQAIRLLPCPACFSSHVACRPLKHVQGAPFVCLDCGAMAFAPYSGQPAGSGWRNGAIAWNAWARRVELLLAAAAGD